MCVPARARAQHDIEESACPHGDRAHRDGAERQVLEEAVVSQDQSDEHERDRHGRQTDKCAQSGPTIIRPQPSVAAAGVEMRPEGIGRPGRSRASMCRSKRSLSTIPAR